MEATNNIITPPFLELVARYLMDQTKGELSNTVVVFPSKRARLYFNKYIREITKQPIWAPRYYTINELMQELSGLHVSDSISLIFEVYRAYVKITKREQSFDDFYFYCETLLADFDDMDKYLVNAKDLFQNLAAIKELENHINYLNEEQISLIKQFWDTFNTNSISEIKQDFLSIWEVLYTIYETLNKQLKSNNQAYEGMIYREVARKIDAGDELPLSEHSFYFVGFNALNPCEKKLFTHLQKNNRARSFWDYDLCYLKEYYHVKHEAGFFMHDNLKNYPSPLSEEYFKSLTHSPKQIKIIDVPSETGQAHIIPEILEDLKEIDEKTAIVLADEQLLLPTLHAIPKEIEDINISMGYPFKETNLFSFLEIIINLQKNVKKQEAGSLFYHRDVLALLNHPYASQTDSKMAKDLADRVVKENIFYPSTQILHASEFFKMVFKACNSVTDFSLYLSDLLAQIYKNNKAISLKDRLFHEFYFHVQTYLQKLETTIKQSGMEIRMQTYLSLLRKLIYKLSIPFSGEPLKGIQIMGILETRALDFENIVLLSMNEGTYPKPTDIPSFIPYSLRKGFDLPTHEHQDAIYSYYFYRLLQRANHITLTYNSSTDGTRTGEMSRFILQMLYEKEFNVKTERVEYYIGTSITQPISISYNDKIKEALLKYGTNPEKLLSPSALNVFLNCRLKFYFRYVEELKEPEELEEEIDIRNFGNILHYTMEQLYKDYKNQFIDSTIIKNIMGQKSLMEEIVLRGMTREYFKRDPNNFKQTKLTGKNLLTKEIILKYTQQILRFDNKHAPFTILDLEKKVYMEYRPKTFPHLVKIGGYIDRLDEKDNHIRIIDYKTGIEKPGFESINSLFEAHTSKRNDAVFQIFLYSTIIASKYQGKVVEPNLLYIRNLFNENYIPIIKIKENRKLVPLPGFTPIKDEFKTQLYQLVDGLFSENAVFDQTEDLKTCQYCPYNGICGRE